MEKVIHKLFTVLVLGGIIGCGGGTITRQTSYFDKFENIQVNRLWNNNISSWQAGWIFHLDIGQMIDHGKTNYFFLLGYMPETSRTLYAQPAGESLVILADGERFGFTKLTSPYWRSDMVYGAQPDVIQKIAAAKTIELKIYAIDGAFTARFSEANSKNFRRFVGQFIDGTIALDR